MAIVIKLDDMLHAHWAAIAKEPALKAEAQSAVLDIVKAACRKPSEAKARVPVDVLPLDWQGTNIKDPVPIPGSGSPSSSL